MYIQAGDRTLAQGILLCLVPGQHSQQHLQQALHLPPSHHFQANLLEQQSSIGATYCQSHKTSHGSLPEAVYFSFRMASPQQHDTANSTYPYIYTLYFKRHIFKFQ